jgi:hypothetical protein
MRAEKILCVRLEAWSAAGPMTHIRAWLFSPAALALLLIFGLVFGFAIAHLASLQWSPIATRAFYLGLLAWGGVLLVQRRKLQRQLGLIDWLFLAFLCLVLASLATQSDPGGTVVHYAKFLPFLVLMPYCIGRLMSEDDFYVFSRCLPWLGALILLLCVMDFWLVPDTGVVYSRWQFFGVNHSPLLIAMLVSAALLALAYRLLSLDAMSSGWKSTAALGLFGLFAMALVLIAARGALIACTTALMLMMGLAQASLRRKLLLLTYFFCSLALAFFVLPKPQTDFYVRMKASVAEGVVLDPQNPQHAQMIVRIKSNPRCRPLIEGINSVAIRRVLYQEAIDLTHEHPLTGIGATRFGDYSCGGSGSYPHSTVLQAFAELGVMGGMLLLILFTVSLVAVARVYLSSNAFANEAMFWLVLIVFFGQLDQIYGNYFMAAGSFFLFGVANRLYIRNQAFKT